jgi:hypothetical protein
VAGSILCNQYFKEDYTPIDDATQSIVLSATFPKKKDTLLHSVKM